jgi:hypothetical protein
MTPRSSWWSRLPGAAPPAPAANRWIDTWRLTTWMRTGSIATAAGAPRGANTAAMSLDVSVADPRVGPERAGAAGAASSSRTL